VTAWLLLCVAAIRLLRLGAQVYVKRADRPADSCHTGNSNVVVDKRKEAE
jgi:hypothetical protein